MRMTLTEGDLLWYFRHNDMVGIKWQELLHLTDVPRRHDYKPVNASSNMEDLLSKTRVYVLNLLILKKGLF